MRTGLYNAFLAAGAPSELNLDHNLRTRLDNRMVRSELDHDDDGSRLRDIVDLFEQAQAAMFKLMASVSSIVKVFRTRS